MAHLRLHFGLALLLAASATAPAAACTTFVSHAGGRVVFGKNYDWMIGDGMVVVNPRGLVRTAEERRTGEPARWTARFGSVSFNQFGRDFPSGGLNEAGLAVELMWLDGSRYPAPDARPVLGNLEWIQYQLDTSATVADVLASDAEVRIEPSGVPLHFLVADRGGAVATIEFLDGRMVAHTGRDLPVAALANTSYGASIADRVPARSDDRSSLGRFRLAARAVERAAAAPPADPVAWAFSTLRAVDSGSYTRWNIVYEVDAGRVHFRTRDRPKVRSLDLADLDFACSSPVRILDLDAPASGDVGRRLVPYRYELNRDLVGRSFAGVPFLADTPKAELDALARHPDSATCAR